MGSVNVPLAVEDPGARALVGGAAELLEGWTLEPDPALAPLATPGGVSRAGVGWYDAETQDVEIEPDPTTGGLALVSARVAVVLMGMGCAAAEDTGDDSSSSLSELLSHASSQSASRDSRPEPVPLALPSAALAGRRGLDEVRKRAVGSARWGCALWGRAGGAAGGGMRWGRR